MKKQQEKPLSLEEKFELAKKVTNWEKSAYGVGGGLEGSIENLVIGLGHTYTNILLKKKHLVLVQIEGIKYESKIDKNTEEEDLFIEVYNDAKQIAESRAKKRALEKERKALKYARKLLKRDYA